MQPLFLIYLRQIILRINHSIMNLKTNISDFLHKQKKKIKYRNEVALVDGGYFSTTHQKSILFFTTHKCASVCVGKLFRQLTKNSGMISVHPGAYFSSIGEDEETVRLKMKAMFRSTGYFYGPLRLPERFELVNNVDIYKYSCYYEIPATF